MRKNWDQLKALKRAYQECHGSWTRDYQVYIAHQLGLTEQQVYKWSWDQLQKRRKVSSDSNSSSASLEFPTRNASLQNQDIEDDLVH
jgi:transposase-like protein